MSIRVRRVDGVTIAICAAKSIPKDGDIYIDDDLHMALARKFWLDYPELGIIPGTDVVELMEQEESNNTNREAWERIFGEHKA